MIKVCLHSEDGVVDHGAPVDKIREIVDRRQGLLWIDVVAPDEADLKTLESQFGFHPLAIEDATRHHQRAKIDSYEGYFFIVFYTLGEDPATDSLSADQIGIFVGQNYVVTVHLGANGLLDEISARWQSNLTLVGSHTVGLLLYSILDAIVDGYFPVVDEISDRIEDLEARVFDDFDRSAQRDVFQLKKDLLGIRRSISPERDVMNVLLRRDTPMFDAATTIYFQDVYDHILRVTDSVDTYRDLLSSVLDAYLSVLSNRMNQVMKTLTASSIILMSMTLVASIYGMNFVHMPELGWHYGYAYALGLMVLIGIGVASVFRRIDWI